MKLSIVPGLAFVVALALFSAEADAQMFRRGGSPTFVGAGGPVSLTPPASAAMGGYSSGYAAAPTFHYSYFAVPNPTTPARSYVGLGGATDFPFHGQAYGHPYDPWTWPYMANGGRGLARYYYPPLK